MSGNAHRLGRAAGLREAGDMAREFAPSGHLVFPWVDGDECACETCQALLAFREWAIREAVEIEEGLHD